MTILGNKKKFQFINLIIIITTLNYLIKRNERMYKKNFENIKVDNCNISQFGKYRNVATDGKALQNTPITAKK